MVHHCSSNPKMKCYFDCPLRDHEFSDLLDVWVWLNREAPSANLEGFGGIDKELMERIVLRKCEITRLFERPEQMQWFVQSGHMTRWLCVDLRRGYFLWKETCDGMSLRQAKRRWKKLFGGSDFLLAKPLKL